MGHAALNQDECIWRFFNHSRSGFFVEVGANDPHDGSQTWLLEQNGWRGLLVEPNGQLVPRLKQLRPASRVFQVACSSPDKTGFADLHVPDGCLHSFATLEQHLEDSTVEYSRRERVELRTLDALLAETGNPAIDFVSIDTEGTELDVLHGFNLQQHHPRLVLIEDKGLSLAKHRHLRSHGYKLVKRTELNNWYVPDETRFTLTTLLERLQLIRKVFLGLPFRKMRHARRKHRKGGD